MHRKLHEFGFHDNSLRCLALGQDTRRGHCDPTFCKDVRSLGFDTRDISTQGRTIQFFHREWHRECHRDWPQSKDTWDVSKCRNLAFQMNPKKNQIWTGKISQMSTMHWVHEVFRTWLQHCPQMSTKFSQWQRFEESSTESVPLQLQTVMP